MLKPVHLQAGFLRQVFALFMSVQVSDMATFLHCFVSALYSHPWIALQRYLFPWHTESSEEDSSVSNIRVQNAICGNFCPGSPKGRGVVHAFPFP